MSLFRAIPIHIHAALEFVAAPALLVAPFFFGFSHLAGAISITLAVLLIGLASSVYGGQGERGNISPSAHAGFDLVLAAVTVTAGILVGLTGDLVATVFLVGFGTAHLALIASTRFTRPLGA
jgi:hypothetical protein